MTTHDFNLNVVDPYWQICIKNALNQMDPNYLAKLYENPNWLPGHHQIFNAFSLPVEKVNYVLFGESPYPRQASANGFAFWDAAVHDIWSPAGLSKPVNRATSFRNLIKMLLVADHLLDPNHTSQPDIIAVDKTALIKTNQELFQNLLDHGFLLLNASLVLQETPVRKDARAWQPFIQHVLQYLFQKRPHIKLILFGNIANAIDELTNTLPIEKLYAEHPYNHSFIKNPNVLNFFKPLQLLSHKKTVKLTDQTPA